MPEPVLSLPSHPEPADAARQRRVAFESLRERTDELELIISGISLVALLALPNWLFEHWVQTELHASGQRRLLLSLLFEIASGLSVTLAGAFLLHLAVRAYWVGLIGLKAAFPAGIRWDAIRSQGPIARDYYRRTVVGLDQAIDAADRVASVVFALVSLISLSVLWIAGVLALISLACIALVAGLGGDEELIARSGLYAFAAVTLLVVLPVLLLDRLWRGDADAVSPWRRALIERLIRLQTIFFPQQLIMSVQLTLESNLPRGLFTLVFLGLLSCAVLLGDVQEKAVREFALVSSYDYFDDSDAEAGLRSAHYENLRSERDVLARVPLLPSDMVADGHLRVFLPYLPERDNAALRLRCPQAADHSQRRACLAGLWQVELDGRPADLAGFVPAERRDLGQRGLQGYLSLAGLAPGAHALQIRWNGPPGKDAAAKPLRYHVPFWFSPPYQQDLAPVAAQ
jgi:hypothetical protein